MLLPARAWSLFSKTFLRLIVFLYLLVKFFINNPAKLIFNILSLPVLGASLNGNALELIYQVLMILNLHLVPLRHAEVS